MPQSLLQRHTTNFIQELQVFKLFPLSQHGGCLNVVNFFLSFIPSFCPRCQCAVVYQPGTPHRPMQEYIISHPASVTILLVIVLLIVRFSSSIQGKKLFWDIFFFLDINKPIHATNIHFHKCFSSREYHKVSPHKLAWSLYHRTVVELSFFS